MNSFEQNCLSQSTNGISAQVPNLAFIFKSAISTVPINYLAFHCEIGNVYFCVKSSIDMKFYVNFHKTRE